jgi:hypothetical protein
MLAFAFVLAALAVVLISFNVMIVKENMNYVTLEHTTSSVESKSKPQDVEEINDKMMVLSGWVGVDNLAVKNKPSKFGKVIGYLPFNEEIKYEGFDNKWFKINYNGKNAYVNSKYILDEDTGYDSYEQYILDTVVGYTRFYLPNNSGFKSFMDYRAITSTGSDQYKLQSMYAETGANGIRMVNGRYCVAVGSHFTSDIGQYFDLILENGTVIPCVLADQKADAHTDSNQIITEHNGCLSEFVVDTGYLNTTVQQRGNASYAEEGWDSPAVEIKVYNKNAFE